LLRASYFISLHISVSHCFWEKRMSEQEKKLAAFIQRWDLIHPGEQLVLAVSGGVDSVVMAHLLLSLQKQLDFYPVIASFNHQLRPEAQEELDFVAELARKWAVPFHGGSADVARLAKGKNLEDVARQERYAFLRKIAYRYGGARIATAHHREDQAETLLLHLLRGSGSSGLSAISPKENGLIRPMLCLSRGEIEAYAARHQLEFRQDRSNFSSRFQRNRVRWELLPHLAEFNPQIVSALNATADICREEDALLEDLASNALAEALDAEDRLSLSALSQMPPALSRRVVRKLFCLQAGEGYELSFDQVEGILSLREGKSLALPGGRHALCRDGALRILREIPELPHFSELYPLILDEHWQALPGWGWEYCCMPLSHTAQPSAKQLHGNAGLFYLVPADAFSAFYWRTRREGDAVLSSGAKGKRKLKDLFIDKKIFPSQRQSWPILTDGKEILWVPGLWKKKLSEIPRDMILIKVRQSDIIK